MALCLTLSLALPSPARALREIQTVDSGLEEQELASALQGPSPELSLTGLEEPVDFSLHGQLEEARFQEMIDALITSYRALTENPFDLPVMTLSGGPLFDSSPPLSEEQQVLLRILGGFVRTGGKKARVFWRYRGGDEKDFLYAQLAKQFINTAREKLERRGIPLFPFSDSLVIPNLRFNRGNRSYLMRVAPSVESTTPFEDDRALAFMAPDVPFSTEDQTQALFVLAALMAIATTPPSDFDGDQRQEEPEPDPSESSSIGPTRSPGGQKITATASGLEEAVSFSEAVQMAEKTDSLQIESGHWVSVQGLRGRGPQGVAEYLEGLVKEKGLTKELARFAVTRRYQYQRRILVILVQTPEVSLSLAPPEAEQARLLGDLLSWVVKMGDADAIAPGHPHAFLFSNISRSVLLKRISADRTLNPLVAVYGLYYDDDLMRAFEIVLEEGAWDPDKLSRIFRFPGRADEEGLHWEAEISIEGSSMKSDFIVTLRRSLTGKSFLLLRPVATIANFGNAAQIAARLLMQFAPAGFSPYVGSMESGLEEQELASALQDPLPVSSLAGLEETFSTLEEALRHLLSQPGEGTFDSRMQALADQSRLVSKSGGVLPNSERKKFFDAAIVLDHLQEMVGEGRMRSALSEWETMEVIWANPGGLRTGLALAQGALTPESLSSVFAWVPWSFALVMQSIGANSEAFRMLQGALTPESLSSVFAGNPWGFSEVIESIGANSEALRAELALARSKGLDQKLLSEIFQSGPAELMPLFEILDGKRDPPEGDVEFFTRTLRLFYGAPILDLSLGSQQFVKMWIEEGLSQGKGEEELREELGSKILPGLKILESFSDLPTQGAEFSLDPSSPENPRRIGRSVFFSQVRVPTRLRPSEGAEMRVLPAKIPVFYLMLVMHLRRGLMDPKTELALTVEDTLDQETLFLLTPLLFGMGLIPEGARFDALLPADAISIANAYQSYIGQTLRPDGGISDISQTYFALPAPSWIRFVVNKMKEADAGSELTEELLFTDTLRFHLEWLAYGSLGAFEHMGKREQGEMGQVYQAAKAVFYRFYQGLQDETQKPLLSPQEIGLLVGQRGVFHRSGSTPYKLDQDQVRPILEKLRVYFLNHVGAEDPYSLPAYQVLVREELSKLREAYYQAHPHAQRLFEQSFLTGLPPAATGLEEVTFYEGFTERATGELAAGLEEMVQEELIQAGRQRAVVKLPAANAPGVRRLFVAGIPLRDFAGLEEHAISMDPATAAQQMAGFGATDADLLVLPIEVAAGLEGSYRPAGSRTPILVLPATGLEELTVPELGALAQIARNLGGVYRAGLEELGERVISRKNLMSISY